MKFYKFLSVFAVAALLSLQSCGPNPEKSRLYLDNGIDYLYHSQFEESIVSLDKAIEYDPNNYEAYYYRGCAKENNFMSEEALADFMKSIEIKPDYYQPYFNIGLIYRRINDMDMACYYFKKAEELGRPNMVDYTKHCK